MACFGDDVAPHLDTYRGDSWFRIPDEENSYCVAAHANLADGQASTQFGPMRTIYVCPKAVGTPWLRQLWRFACHHCRISYL